MLFLHPKIRDVAQSGSVHAWGACGRWFESSHPDEKTKSSLGKLIFLENFSSFNTTQCINIILGCLENKSGICFLL
jgi:hypothetical protein